MVQKERKRKGNRSNKKLIVQDEVNEWVIQAKLEKFKKKKDEQLVRQNETNKI